MKTTIKTGMMVMLLAALVACTGGSRGNNNEGGGGVYKGALLSGDFAEFSVSGSTLSYSVHGYYFPEGKSGAVTIEQVSVGGEATPFYTLIEDGNEVGHAFLGENLGFASIDDIGGSGQSGHVVGLKKIVAPTSAGVVGDYTAAATDRGVMTWKIRDDAVAGKYFEAYDTTGTLQKRGCWTIDSTDEVLHAWDSEDCSLAVTEADYQYTVFIKQDSADRKALVVDFTDGTGIGAGLEQRVISDLTSPMTFYMVCPGQESLQKIVVSPGVNGQDPTWALYGVEGGVWTDVENEGTIRLNETCAGDTVSGLLCAESEDGHLNNVFLDLEEGYFISQDEGEDQPSACFGGAR